MNIAVIFTKDMYEGGAFQYALSLSLLLEKNRSDKYNFIFFTTLKENIKILRKYGLSPLYLSWSNVDRFLCQLIGSQSVSKAFKKLGISIVTKFDRLMEKRAIDLVYFLSPSDMALAADRHSYIFTVWDLCFLEHIEFPEIYMHREVERRNELYRRVLPGAVKVITDSEITKKNITRRYNLDEKKVLSLPFLPAHAMNVSGREYDEHYMDISKVHSIKNRYIFYPAQFWPHKNHIYILEALKLLKEKYKILLSAVFSGSDKGNLHFILKKAKEFGIDDQIHYIGFVEDIELPYLYSQALALVMPTYFGPTNIPPLEAFIMGCPVLYPDLPGLREQVEDSAILLELNNPDSLCQGLIKILDGSPEIKIMVEKGRKKIDLLIKEDRWGKLKTVFDSYAIKLKCWK